MTSEMMHPQVAEALRQNQRLQSALEDQVRMTNASSTGTDEAKTVTVTVDGNRYLTGLDFEEGLLRLGTETVQQRINEAIRNAVAAATEATEAEQHALIETLVDINRSLIAGLGLT